MSDEENNDIPMAECGACGAIVPLDSKSCPSCDVSFDGISDDELGECGACGAIIPVDSESCAQCGASFVAIDNPEQESIDDSESDIEISTSEALEVLDSMIDDTNSSTNDDEDSDDSNDEQEVDTDGDSEEDEDDNSEDDDSEEESDDEEDPEEVEDDDSEEESEDEIEEDDDDLSEEDSEDEEDTEESEEETTDEIPEDEDKKNMEHWRTTVVMAFENLALAIAESGMTASEAFVAVDGNDDNLIDAPELQKGIEKISGELLPPNQVTAILQYLDADDDNRVNPSELVQALEDLKIGIKPGKFPKSKKKKEFPSNVQKFLMGKKANDIFYPIAYFLMVTFIGIWIVNGVGLIVDGSGGPVLYEGDGGVWDHCGTEVGDTLGDDCSGYAVDGEIYPCHITLDDNKCQNSYTPFSGENDADSMPAGFYNDGIVMMVLGLIGLGVVAFLHLFYAPSLRDRVKGKDTTENNDSEEDSGDEEVDSDDDEEDEDDDSDDDEEDEDDDSDDDEEDEDDDSDDDEEDEDDDDEDAIDVGDWVGVEVDGEEFFGEIIEFDDEEDTVTIETEDGDEVTASQDDMFLDDEDDE